MVNSRQKGARGERDFAEFLRRHGYEARRGQQYSGSPDSPDVIHDVPGVQFEVKRTERLRLYDALEQADSDCPDDLLPVVAHRQNGRPWVAIMDAVDFLALCRKGGFE